MKRWSHGDSGTEPDLRNVDLADLHSAPRRSADERRNAWWLGWWIGKGGKWWCPAYPRHAHRWRPAAWWCRQPAWNAPVNSPTPWVFALIVVAIVLAVFGALELAEWIALRQGAL